MSTISIRRTHHLGHEQARAAAEQMLESLQRKHGIEGVWQGDTLNIRGSGLSGTLEVTPDQLALELKLGMMLAMFRGAIIDSIESKLDDVLGG